MQLSFFLSVFKYAINLKNIIANYHLLSMSIFLHYHIRFAYTYAWVLSFENESAFFRAARAQADNLSKPCTQLKSWKFPQ